MKTYAKINLALWVGPPEPAASAQAGWHPIESWMHAIDLADDLDFDPDGASRLELDLAWATDAPRPTPMDWPPERDLTIRAMHALGEAIGRPVHGKLTLRKRIPVGGGLGGGSSNAAGALLLANTRLSLGLSMPELRMIGQRLGSDVAYFLDDDVSQLTGVPPRPALVRGFGDEVERIAGSRDALTVFIPPYGCATPAVYRAFDELGHLSPRLDVAGMHADAVSGSIAEDLLRNDLLEPACRVEPRLAADLERVGQATGRRVHLSGSGSTMFVLGEWKGRLRGIAVAGCRLTPGA
ncbi:MAG: hypothetical protein KIT24_09485 [Phycisphaeraceae bacterium]|nr:hypothetical protein [Phycisphaeraceae bacterium]